MIVQCGLRGCSKPAYVEPRTGITHKYCGRSHAEQAQGAAIPPPHGSCSLCNLAGCREPVAFDATTGRVHDFCSKEHAEEAMRQGQWARPQRELSSNLKLKVAHPCALPGCGLEAYRDGSGLTYDYCGRSHAIVDKQQSASSTLNASTGIASQQPRRRLISVSEQQAQRDAAMASPKPAPSIVPQAPLCVVCQEHNADMIILPCGHICLCQEHEKSMKAAASLAVCPCCKQAVTSTNRVFFNH